MADADDGTRLFVANLPFDTRARRYAARPAAAASGAGAPPGCGVRLWGMGGTGPAHERRHGARARPVRGVARTKRTGSVFFCVVAAPAPRPLFCGPVRLVRVTVVEEG